MDKVWFWAFGWTKNIIKTRPGILGAPGQLSNIDSHGSIRYNFLPLTTMNYYIWHWLTSQRIFGNSVQRVNSVTLGILGSIHYHWLSLSALVDSPRNIWWPISTLYPQPEELSIRWIGHHHVGFGIKFPRWPSVPGLIKTLTGFTKFKLKG